MRAEVSGCVVMQEARSVCSVQYAAHGGDCSALGGARVSGGCSAAVGGGVAEAVAVLFTLGCRLSEPGSGNCHTRSAARHGAREHMHSCGSARTACVTIYHEPLSMFGAIDENFTL